MSSPYSTLRKIVEQLLSSGSGNCPDCGKVPTGYTKRRGDGLADEVCIICGRVIGG